MEFINDQYIKYILPLLENVRHVVGLCLTPRYSLKCENYKAMNGGWQTGVPQCKRSGGFSLVELMVVIVVIAILAAIAVPNYNAYVTKSYVAEMLMLGKGMAKEVEFTIMQQGTTAVTVAAKGAIGTTIANTVMSGNGCIIMNGTSLTQGMQLTLKPTITNDTVVWSCQTNAVPYYKYLPTWCQNPQLGGC
jgi:type IV pilus assembly protein PilA